MVNGADHAAAIFTDRTRDPAITDTWQQRLLAVAYGGDPLAIDPGASWSHPFGEIDPGAPAGQTAPLLGAPLLRVPWPSRGDLPYVTEAVTAPQVFELLRLAQRVDAVDLVVSPAGCRAIDVEATATRLFEGVEAALRIQACHPNVDPDCGIPEPASLPDDDTRLWTLHRVTRAHARSLARFLAEALGPNLPPNDLALSGACTGLSGVFRLRGELLEGPEVKDALGVAVPAGTVRFRGSMAPRDLRDWAPRFTAMGAVRVPVPS